MRVAIDRRVYPASEGERFSADATLRVVGCPTCGVTYAIPESFHRAAREHNKAVNPRNYWTICCPFGHEWYYPGLNREQELEEEVRRQRDRAGRLAADRDQVAASRRAHKAAATRARHQRDRLAKRSKAGVCPCCNRTFKQLARHMQSQHPNFDGEDA